MWRSWRARAAAVGTLKLAKYQETIGFYKHPAPFGVHFGPPPGRPVFLPVSFSPLFFTRAKRRFISVVNGIFADKLHY